MSIAVDSITRRKLLLVKQIYLQALAPIGSHQSITSRLMAVIGFDLAIETCLKTIIVALDQTKAPADNFQALVQQAEALLQGSGQSLPDRINIQFVHTVRNDAQHKAKYPSDTEVSDCRLYCRDFLDKLCLGVWGLDFSSMSVADSIQDPSIRDELKKAEQELDAGNIAESITCATAALTKALEMIEAAIVGDLPTYSHALVAVDTFERPMISADNAKIFRAFERTRETVLLVALGMNRPEYWRFRRIAGRVTNYVGGGRSRSGGIDNAQTSDAQYVIGYCSETIVQIETYVGSIEEPFGDKHWHWSWR